MDELYHTPEKRQPRHYKKFPPAKPGHKFCNGCDQELLFEVFAIRKGRYYSRCRECERKQSRDRIRPYHTEQRHNPRNKPKSKIAKEGHRYCNICEQELPYEEFYLLKGKIKAVCRTCERERDRERNKLRYVRLTPIKPIASKEGHKVCNTCFEEKPFEAFKKTSLFKDGHAGRCKQCDQDLRANYTEEVREQERARKQAYRQAHLNEIQEYDRARSKTVHHRQIRRVRDNKPENRIKINQRIEEWRKAHPLQKREQLKRRKAQGNVVEVEKVDYERILERDGWQCYICGQDINPTLKSGSASLAFDHVIPLIPRANEPQGTHTAKNIKPVHKLCNSRKANRSLNTLTPFDRRGL
jgi:hypothetical protein